MDLLQNIATLLGSSGQWDSCNTMRHYWGAIGSGSPLLHRLTRKQWKVDLLQYTVSLGDPNPILPLVPALALALAKALALGLDQPKR